MGDRPAPSNKRSRTDEDLDRSLRGEEEPNTYSEDEDEVKFNKMNHRHFVSKNLEQIRKLRINRKLISTEFSSTSSGKTSTSCICKSEKTGELFFRKKYDKDDCRETDFMREVHFLLKLRNQKQNKYIVKIITVGYLDILLEKADSTLEHLLKNATLGITVADDLIQQLCTGIKILHDYDIVHRDLKPDNILIFHKPDQSLRLKIADFGTARTQLNSSAGTEKSHVLWYRSPLQKSGGCSPLVDLYSFALIILDIISNRNGVALAKLTSLKNANITAYNVDPDELGSLGTTRNQWLMIKPCIFGGRQTYPTMEDMFNFINEEWNSKDSEEPIFKESKSPKPRYCCVIGNNDQVKFLPYARRATIEKMNVMVYDMPYRESDEYKKDAHAFLSLIFDRPLSEEEVSIRLINNNCYVDEAF